MKIAINQIRSFRRFLLVFKTLWIFIYLLFYLLPHSALALLGNPNQTQRLGRRCDIISSGTSQPPSLQPAFKMLFLKKVGVQPQPQSSTQTNPNTSQTPTHPWPKPQPISNNITTQPPPNPIPTTSQTQYKSLCKFLLFLRHPVNFIYLLILIFQTSYIEDIRLKSIFFIIRLGNSITICKLLLIKFTAYAGFCLFFRHPVIFIYLLVFIIHISYVEDI